MLTIYEGRCIAANSTNRAEDPGDPGTHLWLRGHLILITRVFALLFYFCYWRRHGMILNKRNIGYGRICFYHD